MDARRLMERMTTEATDALLGSLAASVCPAPITAQDSPARIGWPATLMGVPAVRPTTSAATPVAGSERRVGEIPPILEVHHWSRERF